MQLHEVSEIPHGEFLFLSLAGTTIVCVRSLPKVIERHQSRCEAISPNLANATAPPGFCVDRSQRETLFQIFIHEHLTGPYDTQRAQDAVHTRLSSGGALTRSDLCRWASTYVADCHSASKVCCTSLAPRFGTREIQRRGNISHRYCALKRTSQPNEQLQHGGPLRSITHATCTVASL